MMKNLPIVSFIIVARNACKYLPAILSKLLTQDYPKNNLEILLVDGGSTDNTRNIMENFAKEFQNLNIRILDNPKRILSSGWNVALAAAKGDIILRVDAHSSIHPDFISKNIDTILSGESIVGGPTISNMPVKMWAGLLAMCERSKFGSGAADFRNPGPPKYVGTLAYAAYRRDIFETVGGYDERLVRNQDMEIHYRMKKAGYKFFFNPEIISYHKARSSLMEMLRQKWNDGKWVGLIIGIQPHCFSIRHFIPGFFVCLLISSLILSKTGLSWTPLILLGIFYMLVAITFTIEAISKAPFKIKPLCIFLPIIFFLIHVSYGLGTLYGLVKMPIFIWKNRNYQLPWPIKQCK